MFLAGLNYTGAGLLARILGTGGNTYISDERFSGFIALYIWDPTISGDVAVPVGIIPAFAPHFPFGYPVEPDS